MISYAQNQEDVMLARALAGTTNGFYIDVGAHDPVIDSVTKMFYDRGGRGINVEPGAIFARLPIGGRQDDLAMQGLDRPAVPHE